MRKAWIGLGIGVAALAALIPATATAQSGDARVAMATPVSAPADVTFHRDVERIFQRACQTCHREGSVAPFSLTSYESARRYAARIRERTQARVMPPFPYDRTVGIQDFKNDARLTDAEIATIAAWVDAGAPQGNPADAPAPIAWKPASEYWEYEQFYGRPPDLVIESPAYTVVANGMDQWPEPVADVVGLDRERWIRAIEIRPKDPKSGYVFHHGNPGLQQADGNGGLIASAVGKRGEIYPEDAGKLIQPGAKVSFGMHFHPMEEDVEAVMQLGLWFYPEGERPRYETPGEVQFRADQSTGGSDRGNGHSQDIARRSDLLIAPNSTATYQGTYVLRENTRIQSLRGHMHVRGKNQILEAIYPDGRRELISKLDWDHAWHTAFVYEDDARPLLPRGTVLLITSIFDNTANNPLNPDPNQWVVAGSRTVDEMSHIWVGLTEIEDDAEFQAMVEERERMGVPAAQQQ
jgi:mono/diheme cytochrome c family protein